jgi:hypothetical protein
MISKSDWEAACDDLIAAGRERHEPPTLEEIEALFLGTLPEAEAGRVRELLAYYPELVQAMTDPFPDDDDGVLTEAELAVDLAKIRTGLPTTPFIPPVRHFPVRWAIAAGVVIVLSLGGLALLWRPRADAPPRLAKILYADGERGGSTRGATAQPSIDLTAGTAYLLQPVFTPERAYREYRLELVDGGATPPRTIWSRTVERQANGSYPMELSSGELEPGRYQLLLYGIDGKAELLATYTLRVYER